MTAEPGKRSTFRAGLIQTRAGEQPAANLDTVVKLIGEAKAGGASYVQTPEMTNIMVASRDKLLAAIVPEENDTSLATFRELARKLGVYLHIGSLAVKATAEKAANRSFLIDPHGEIAARYDRSICSTSILPMVKAIASRGATGRANRPCCTICPGAGSD